LVKRGGEAAVCGMADAVPTGSADGGGNRTMQEYEQGDTVCVDTAATEDGPADGKRWQAGVIMAVMPEGRYRAGFYAARAEVVVGGDALRPRADGEECPSE
jgi:hypothetical protein